MALLRQTAHDGAFLHGRPAEGIYAFTGGDGSVRAALDVGKELHFKRAERESHCILFLINLLIEYSVGLKGKSTIG